MAQDALLPLDQIQSLRQLLGNRDGLQLTDADGTLTLYISPDRVRARRDLTRTATTDPHPQNLGLPPSPPVSREPTVRPRARTHSPIGGRSRAVSDTEEEGADDELERAPPPVYGSQDRQYTSTNRIRKRLRDRARKQGGSPALPSPKRRRKLSRPAVRPSAQEAPEPQAGPAADQAGAEARRHRVQAATAWLETALPTAGLPESGTRFSQQMVRTALAIGSVQVIQEWQALLRQWRSTRRVQHARAWTTPNLDLSADARRQLVDRHPHLQGRHAAVQDFYQAWTHTESLQVDGFIMAVAHRAGLQALAGAYDRAVGHVDGRRGRGRGERSLAKQMLFGIAYPQWKEIPQPTTFGPSRTAWTTFEHRLAKARRWATVANALGPGVITIMSTVTIPHAWVERTLTTPALALWLRLVDAVNPEARIMGALALRVITDLQTRQRPSSKLLQLEVTLPAHLEGDSSLLPQWEDALEGLETSADEGSRTPSRPAADETLGFPLLPLSMISPGRGDDGHLPWHAGPGLEAASQSQGWTGGGEAPQSDDPFADAALEAGLEYESWENVITQEDFATLSGGQATGISSQYQNGS